MVFFKILIYRKKKISNDLLENLKCRVVVELWDRKSWDIFLHKKSTTKFVKLFKFVLYNRHFVHTKSGKEITDFLLKLLFNFNERDQAVSSTLSTKKGKSLNLPIRYY